jgi:hypothetical protein
MNVVAAMPTAAKAKPMSTAAGRARTAHHDPTRPRTVTMTRKPAEYRPHRVRHHPISPRATSPTCSGVASMAS